MEQATDGKGNAAPIACRGAHLDLGREPFPGKDCDQLAGRDNIAAMAFDPNLAGGYKKRQEHEPDLVLFLEALRWCDTLVLVHPMWWGAAPEKLKGLIDRVFLPGIAFAYEGDGHFPKKLFEGRTSRVLITTDTTGWYLWFGYRNGWLNVPRRQILDLVGLKVTHIKTIGPIRGATLAKIAWFKDAARKLVS